MKLILAAILALLALLGGYVWFVVRPVRVWVGDDEPWGHRVS
jgi:hypothetical protein